jgi:hypothetical protein
MHDLQRSTFYSAVEETVAAINNTDEKRENTCLKMSIITCFYSMNGFMNS